LNPALTVKSSLSQLNGGNGLSLTSINIANGSASGVITLSSAATIGDVINQINNSGLNVTASINSQGNALRVTSNNSATVAVASEVGNGTSAQDLGLGGGRNVFTTMVNLRDALNKNDHQAIIALQSNLNAGLSSVSNGRAILGAVLNQAQNAYDDNNQQTVDLHQQISTIEDTDMASAASHLAQMQTAFQATLQTTARIIQPSLLDFLK
jgi:flagellar hook-associated protein 3 FlgL